MKIREVNDDMDHKDIATPSRTRALLNQYGFDFKKSLGQNFLIDVNIINKIIDASNIDKSTGIIEVGPGMGSLTEQLAKHAKKVMSFEIDHRLIPVLKETLAPYDNVTIINEDILKADIASAVSEHLNDCDKIMVVANLPYYITTPILLNLMQQDIPIDGYVVMMQKEVGERLNAEVGTKAYGSLSIVTQYYTETSKVLTVPKTVFMPPPNVDSIVVKLMQRETPLVDVDDEEAFFKLAKAAFAQRRKTINNNYQNFFKDGKQHKESILNWLEKAGIDPRRRGETLSIQDFAMLYKEMDNFPELVN
ncbi:16S rRNA (adenine1518-N6/adenine1519-N6)-dimethyltransferase [Staphylococcus pasteuri]